MKIIAEVGSNWKTFDDCTDAIIQAARAGAHAVKFQYYNSHDLYGDQVPGLRGEMPGEWVKRLAFFAETKGVEFMCTAFSPNGYTMVNKYVKAHKVASAELPAVDILEVVNSFKKPVYLSTGGSTIEEIDTAVKILKDCKVTLMFCVADYPARVVDFRNLSRLRDNFPLLDVGFSDHSTDVLNIPVLARDAGATVIEKHVNFSPFTDTPDAGHSISGDELRLMIKAIQVKRIDLEETDALTNIQMRKNWRRKPFTQIDGSVRWYRPKPA